MSKEKQAVAEVVERYEVVKTLLTGAQNVKRDTRADGTERISAHRKPVGFVLKDLKTNKLLAMTHLEATEAILIDGAVNVQITATTRTNAEGVKVPVPYPKSKAGYPPLQSEKLVVTNAKEFLEKEKDIAVSEALNKALTKKTRRRGGGGRAKAEPKYSKEALMEALKARKAAALAKQK